MKISNSLQSLFQDTNKDIISILTFFLLISPLPISIYCESKFVIIAGLLSLYFFFNAGSRIERTDSFWVLFLVISAISISNSINLSFSYNNLASWTLLILVFYWAKNQKTKVIQALMKACEYITLILLLFTTYIIFTKNQVDYKIWNVFFNHNSNYIVALLVVVSPSLLFAKYNSLFKIISFSLILTVIIFTSAKAVFMCFIMNMIIYFYFNRQHINFKKIKYFLTIAIIVIMALGFITNLDFAKLPLIDDFLSTGNEARDSLFYNSYYLFLEKPLLGHGIGMWEVMVYENDFLNYPFNNQSQFTRYFSHNIFMKILGETGIIGAACFILPFLFLFKNIFKEIRNISAGSLFCFLLIIDYLFLANFYAEVSFRKLHLSSIQLLCFISCGLVNED